MMRNASRWAWVVALGVMGLMACGDDETSASTSTGATSGSGGASSASTSDGGAAATTTASASATGAGGAAGVGGAGGGGAGVPTGSDGCGVASADPTAQWVAKTVQSGGVMREYFVYLPAGYDPAEAYPIVYQFHGCSGSANKENNNPPVQDQSGADAIHVRGRAVGNCWETGANGADVAFFDDLSAAVEGAYCADVDRRFATGYSSGAFMTHRLACVRGDVLRGVASIAGGLAGNNCVGQTAALLIHDDTDTTVDISSSQSARDRHLTNNGCGDASGPTTPGDHSPCVVYTDCDAGLPVVWCETTGQNHSRQDSLAAPAFWDFLSGL